VGPWPEKRRSADGEVRAESPQVLERGTGSHRKPGSTTAVPRATLWSWTAGPPGRCSAATVPAPRRSYDLILDDAPYSLSLPRSVATGISPRRNITAVTCAATVWTGVRPARTGLDVLCRSCCHLVVSAGETAVLPWTYDAWAPPGHAAAVRHSAGLGARLPTRQQCECAYQRLVSELALRGPLRLPAHPEPCKLDASTPARLEPPVSRSECPVCGAPRHQRVPRPGVPPAFRAGSS
jgi:hypothetical protein